MNEISVQRAARLEVVAAGATLSQLGLISPGEGNLSHRLDIRRILVSGSGADKGRLNAADLLIVELDSAADPAGASCETGLHRSVYKKYDEVNAIVHAHPLAVRSLAERARVPDCNLTVEGHSLFGEISLVPPLPCGSAQLAQTVCSALSKGTVCVMAGHGAVAVGDSMESALRRMIQLERIARLELEGTRD